MAKSTSRIAADLGIIAVLMIGTPLAVHAAALNIQFGDGKHPYSGTGAAPDPGKYWNFVTAPLESAIAGAVINATGFLYSDGTTPAAGVTIRSDAVLGSWDNGYLLTENRVFNFLSADLAKPFHLYLSGLSDTAQYDLYLFGSYPAYATSYSVGSASDYAIGDFSGPPFLQHEHYALLTGLTPSGGTLDIYLEPYDSSGACTIGALQLAVSQPILSGHVYDLFTSKAIPDATVQLVTTSTDTDASGYYGFTNVSPGSYFTIVSATNYPNLLTNLLVNGSQTVNFYLGNPDLAVIALAWNTTNSGLDFAYTNRGNALTNETTAKVFWASGPSTNDILADLPPAYTVHIPAGFTGQASVRVTEAHFSQPPPTATFVQVVLDYDKLVTEFTKTNNAMAIPLTFRHVVLVMMENRSFDHFLGWLPGADGRLGGIYTNATGQAWTNFHLTYFQGCGCDDPDHSYLGGRTALNPQTSACDGWLMANPRDIYSIGYYLPTDLSFFSQIAPSWTVCDRYFAALLAETQPNRIYQHAAQTDCLTNRVTWQLTLPTIWDSLSSSNVSARYYYDGSSFAQTPLVMWGTKYVGIEYGTSQFYADCANGSLPSVSFVDPEMTSTTAFAVAQDNNFAPPGIDTGGNDDHPHADIRNGELFLSRVFNAIASSPQWSSTVFIINFDEWGGFYDHVVPPVVPLDQIPNSDSSAYRAVGISSADPTFGSRGFRVPCIVISPWSHTSKVTHFTFDHTSVLKLIEDRWGLPNLTARDFNALDLTNAMDFDHPNYAAPDVLPNVQNGSPFGGFCKSIQLEKQADGKLAAFWDSTCLKVTLQMDPTINGPWTDQPGVLTPPYLFAPIAGSGRAFMIRFKVVASGYVTLPL